MTSTRTAHARRAAVTAITIAPPLGSVGLVIMLHVLQPSYDPAHQLISELALGPHGWVMLPAFAMLAAACVALQHVIRAHGASRGLRVLLWIAATGFFGAGVVPLGPRSEIHIGFVALAFVAIVLAMVRFPSTGGTAAARVGRWASWSFALGVVVAGSVGPPLVAMGVSQRIAASCLVAWLVFVGFRLRKH